MSQITFSTNLWLSYYLLIFIVQYSIFLNVLNLKFSKSVVDYSLQGKLIPTHLGYIVVQCIHTAFDTHLSYTAV